MRFLKHILFYLVFDLALIRTWRRLGNVGIVNIVKVKGRRDSVSPHAQTTIIYTSNGLDLLWID